jgi:transcriptional regulator with XRE-family HTH domain
VEKTNKNARFILAKNIRLLRGKQKISQEELAFRSGLHRTYISSVERCQRNISIDAIEKIAEAFKTPLYKLLEDEK